MPTPTEWAGAGIAVGGNLIGALNGAAAARRQNRILGNGIRQQSVAGMDSTHVLGDFISQLRASRPDATSERGAFNAALGPGAVSGPPTASRAFRASAADANTGARGYGQNLAGLFARIRAPELQRQQEGELLMDAGNALRPIQMRAQDDAFLTQLRAGMQQPNPWVGLLGQGATNVGNYLMSGRGGT